MYSYLYTDSGFKSTEKATEAAFLYINRFVDKSILWFPSIVLGAAIVLFGEKF